VRGDASKLPVAHGTMDWVLCKQVSHHIPRLISSGQVLLVGARQVPKVRLPGSLADRAG
jgi:hypothetical protein